MQRSMHKQVVNITHREGFLGTEIEGAAFNAPCLAHADNGSGKVADVYRIADSFAVIQNGVAEW